MKTLSILALCIAAGCSSPPAPTPPAQVPQASSLACTDPSGVCCRSCKALARAGCREAAPTQKGTSCEAVCLNVSTNSSVPLPDVSSCLDVGCIRAAGIECK